MQVGLSRLVFVGVVLLFVIMTAGFAESAPEEQWSRTFGGQSYDGAASVQQTSDGGYILAGCTESFGTGSGDAWLIKTDSKGNEQWNKTLGQGVAYSVEQTSDGGYIMVGYAGSFETGITDAWLIKTDSKGNEQWSRTFGGVEYSDEACSVQHTSDGGYILAGHTYSFKTNGLSDAWLIKTDSKGSEQWNRTFGEGWPSFATSVQQTSDGGYLLAGYTDLGFGAWLIKTNSKGNQLWSSRTFGTSDGKYEDYFDKGYQDYVTSSQQTSDGGYILAGFRNEVYVIQSGGSYSKSAVLLIKIDSKGNQQWDETFDEGNACSVKQTSDGGYLLAGYTESFETGTTDAWLIKTDSQGNEQWKKTFSEGSGASSVQLTSDGGYILAGSTTSFGAVSSDAWLIKLGEQNADSTPAVEDNVKISEISLNRNPSKTSQVAFKYGSQNYGEQQKTLDIGIHLIAEACNPTENDLNVEGIVTLESPSGDIYKKSSVVDTIDAGETKTLIYRVFYPDSTGYDMPETGTWKIKLQLFGAYRELLDEKETTIEVLDSSNPTEKGPSEKSIGNMITWEYSNDLDMQKSLLLYDDFKLVLGIIQAYYGGGERPPALQGSYTNWISDSRAAEAALNTGEISIDSQKNSFISPRKIGDVETITLTYQNTPENYKNGLGDLMLFSTAYDRAVVIAKVNEADSIVLIDDGGADYNYINPDDNSIVLVWITEKPDKLALIDEPESKEFKIKYLASADIKITVDLSLQLGPYPENPYDIIKENEQKISLGEYNNLRDPSTIDYTKWINQPDEVYWVCIGTDIAEISFKVLEGEYISVESSTGAGKIYINSENGNIDELVPVSIQSMPLEPPSETNLKYGLFRFTINDVDLGGAETVSMGFPDLLPEKTEYWKFGPTKDNTISHWYTIPCTTDGNELSITIVDGGLGDDDLTVNGRIIDDGGPSIMSVSSYNGSNVNEELANTLFEDIQSTIDSISEGINLQMPDDLKNIGATSNFYSIGLILIMVLVVIAMYRKS